MQVFTLTRSHDRLVSAIYSSAAVQIPFDFGEKPQNPDGSWVKALWDTGATHSAISERLAAQMQLPTEDFVDVYTAVGILQVPVYSLRVVFPNQLVFDEIEAVEFTGTETEDCDLIIGMDIITQGDFSITNMDGRTVFSFRVPSLHIVDFEAVPS